jgi:enoyl-CoA hydratase/carnithine racemase
MILCNERIDAATAGKIGLVEEVVETGTALERALALAAQAAQQSPSAVARCKRLIHSARDKAIEEGLVRERELFVELFSTADQREGVNAFLEKREPHWKNA